MWGKEGGVGERGIISCQPNLVASIPCKRVEVAQESGFFDIMLHEAVKCDQCGFVPFADKSSGAHLKAIHFASIACDVTYEWSIFL